MTTTAAGFNGQVAFDGRTVTITREGFMARSTQGRGSKAIPLASVGAIQFQPPTFFRGMGVWSVSVAGEVQSSRAKVSRQDLMKDENTIFVRRGQVAEFEALSAAVNEALASA